MKITLSDSEKESILRIIEDLLNDDGHAISESITSGFDLEDFEISITVSKIAP